MTARGADGLRLVVRAPDGSTQCTEGGPAGASLRQTWTPGTHHVWVGSDRRSAPSYELVLAP
ncbi:MAG: hypothetical protein M5U28_19260 [Sandaracinaceae bacterium]|nr:hypothetical protein [Sandaracinaceae bacterium]